MARIRTVKPEFWTSEQVAECSPTARLLFIGLWNFCDDGGVHPDSPKRIKMEIFPADDLTVADIGRMVDELIQHGLLQRYSVDGESYLHVTGWSKHQKVDKPNFRYPSPNAPGAVAENSPRGRRTGADRSPPESKGREGSLREGKESQTTAAASSLDAAREPAAAAGSDQTYHDLGERILKLCGGTVLSYGRLRKWLDEGCDPELDILPAIKAVIDRERRHNPQWVPRGLKYFDGAIADAKASRTAPMPSPAPVPSGRGNGVAKPPKSTNPVAGSEEAKRRDREVLGLDFEAWRRRQAAAKGGET